MCQFRQMRRNVSVYLFFLCLEQTILGKMLAETARFSSLRCEHTHNVSSFQKNAFLVSYNADTIYVSLFYHTKLFFKIKEDTNKEKGSRSQKISNSHYYHTKGRAWGINTSPHQVCNTNLSFFARLCLCIV